MDLIINDPGLKNVFVKSLSFLKEWFFEMLLGL